MSVVSAGMAAPAHLLAQQRGEGLPGPGSWAPRPTLHVQVPQGLTGVGSQLFVIVNPQHKTLLFASAQV